MATTVTTSTKFSLNLNDFWKGFLVAVLGGVIAIIQTSINEGNFHFDWMAIGKTALFTALAYLAKNFLSPAKIVVSGATADTITAVKDGDIDVRVGTTIAKVVTNAPPNNP